MKVFWAILAVLVIGGASYAFVSARTSAERARAAEAQALAQPTQAAQTNPAPPKPAETRAAEKPPVSDAELNALKKQQDDLAAQLAQTKAAKLAADEPAKQAAPAEEPKPTTAPDAKPADAKPAPDKPAEPKPEVKQAEQPKPAANDGYSISGGSIAPAGVTGQPATQVGAPKAVVAQVKEDKPAKFQGFEIVPAKIEKKDDGSMLVDGKYLIKGEGTAEKPYVVPWDVLTSVEETFDPQSEKKKLPERVTMLDGKVVKFSGYIAFPLAVKEAKECLSMLNQWDGCCIGVPPTPYDAVEVSLTRTIKGEERFTTAGSVIGTFKVKPYLQGDWLIGLYVMEGADLKSRDYGGSAGS
jgi:hypothetical protein